VPPGKPSLTSVIVPPLFRVKKVTPGVTAEFVSSETSPVGVPAPLLGVTLMLTLADAPWVKVGGVRERVVVVGRNVIEFQPFTRLFTFTEPRPVAWSYPTVL